MPDANNELIRAEGVSRHFSDNSLTNKRSLHAVDDVSFTVRRRERLAIVGESGCGKTTLARLILGLYEPTSGRIVVDGFGSVHELRKKQLGLYRKTAQMVFQDPFAALNPAHQVGTTMRRAIKLYDPATTNRTAHERALELLRTVGLHPAEDFVAKFPHQLSGGQRQRIVVARALALQPSIIVADEPTSMLDVSIGIDILNLLLDIGEKEELTTIIVTHNLGQARYFAQRVLVMYAGTVVEIGPMDSILAAPRHPYTVLLRATTPDPTVKRPEIQPRGEPPSLWNPKPICRFYDRCPVRMEKCAHELPPLTPVGDGHFVRCYHYPDASNVPAPAKFGADIFHAHEEEVE